LGTFLRSVEAISSFDGYSVRSTGMRSFSALASTSPTSTPPSWVKRIQSPYKAGMVSTWRIGPVMRGWRKMAWSQIPVQDRETDNGGDMDRFRYRIRYQMQMPYLPDGKGDDIVGHLHGVP